MDDQWLPLTIAVFAPAPDGFHEDQAASVQQWGNQWGGAVQQSEDRGDCFAWHDHGGVALLVGTDGMAAALPGVVVVSGGTEITLLLSTHEPWKTC